MEAILKFNLPDEQDDYILAIKGKDYWGALWDLQDKIRDLWKYSQNDEEIKLGEKMQEIFNNILENNNVNLNEVN